MVPRNTTKVKRAGTATRKMLGTAVGGVRRATRRMLGTAVGKEEVRVSLVTRLKVQRYDFH